MITLAKYCIWFAIYSFIGWIYESLLRSFTNKRWYNSGFLNGPYIPIYGFGAIMDIYFLGSLKNPILIFFISATINCILEYLTSYVMELIFHARWWDYSQMKFNLNGRVCLLGYIAFGVFALVVILYFHPWLVIHTTDLMNAYTIYFLSLLIVTTMSIDTYITVTNMKDFEQKVEELSLAVDELKIKINQNIESRIDSLSYIEKIKVLQQKLNAQEIRLINAFPDLKFKQAKYEAQEITKMIIEANKKTFLERRDD